MPCRVVVVASTVLHPAIGRIALAWDKYRRPLFLANDMSLVASNVLGVVGLGGMM